MKNQLYALERNTDNKIKMTQAALSSVRAVVNQSNSSKAVVKDRKTLQ